MSGWRDWLISVKALSERNGGGVQVQSWQANIYVCGLTCTAFSTSPKFCGDTVVLLPSRSRRHMPDPRDLPGRRSGRQGNAAKSPESPTVADKLAHMSQSMASLPLMRNMSRHLKVQKGEKTRRLERNSALVDSIVIEAENLDPHDELRVGPSGGSVGFDKRPRFLIHPQNHCVALWDTLTSSTLLFISIYTPLEVAFLPSSDAGSDPFFILGRVIDGVFLLDMILQFFLMIPKEDDHNQLETRWSIIIKAYLHPLRGWFLLDAFSLGASAFDVVPIFLASNEDSGGSTDVLAVFRVVRVLRLVKLTRLLKASKRLKEWSVKIATPRATLTIFQIGVECMYVMHWAACIFGIISLLASSPLDTWLATHGLCTPREDLDWTDYAGGLVRGFECVPAYQLYMQCILWSGGMLMGAPISLSPHKGPFERHYSAGGPKTLFRFHEELTILILKVLTAFEWVTVLARFVQVYNNLDPDARDFKAGWDALNRFVKYFSVQKPDAQELRRYYVERSDMAKAKTRMRVMNDFSPYLAEKFVWKLNKDWLMKVPCFSLVVERLVLQPQSGMERFLVKVALAMQPEVYCPSERPQAKCLYIITDGSAMHRGNRLTKGDSWGAEDVLMSGRAEEKCYRAISVTYLHVLWIGFRTFVQLGSEHPVAYNLTRLWAIINAAGGQLIRELRAQKQKRTQILVSADPNEGHISPAEIERRINGGEIKIKVMRSEEGGKRITDGAGRTLYCFFHKIISMDGVKIIRQQGKHGRDKFRVLQTFEGSTRINSIPKHSSVSLLESYDVPTVIENAAEAGAASSGSHEGKSSALVPSPIMATSQVASAPAPSANGITSDGTVGLLAAQISALTDRFQAQVESQQTMSAELAAVSAAVNALAAMAPTSLAVVPDDKPRQTGRRNLGRHANGSTLDA